MADDGIVNLNVGGTTYTTTVSTMTKHPESMLGEFFGRLQNKSRNPSKQGESPLEATRTSKASSAIVPYGNDTYFIDRDGMLFRYILNYLRTGNSLLPNSFAEKQSLMEEALFFGLSSLAKQLECSDYDTKVSDGQDTCRDNGCITIGYRGTFGFGRSYGDAKFRKISRILVCGKATLCKEVFGHTLNESRDPDRVGENRYTSRMYLKHNNLELAFDTLYEHQFRLITGCGAGASTGFAIGGHVDSEELKWNHYNEFVFTRW